MYTSSVHGTQNQSHTIDRGNPVPPNSSKFRNSGLFRAISNTRLPPSTVLGGSGGLSK